MAQILIARPNGKRWNRVTLIDVYPDADILETSFGDPTMYHIVKLKNMTVDEVRDKLQAIAGKIFDPTEGTMKDRPYPKQLDCSAITAADLQVLRDKTATRAEKLAILSKLMVF